MATPPVNPLIGVPKSSLAIIGAAPTVTVTTAVSQFVGFKFSHKVYVTVYVPTGVFGATVTLPSGLTVKGPFVFGVRVTRVKFTFTPFKVSLLNTLIPASPPTMPLIGPAVSSLAHKLPKRTIVAPCVEQVVSAILLTRQIIVPGGNPVKVALA